MAEIVHTLAVSGTGSPHYSSLATLESEMNANDTTPSGGPSWEATWSDNHVIAVMHSGSSDEVSGRLGLNGVTMNGFRLIIRPATGDGYKDHASAATNPQFYDNTIGACWKETTGDYCFLGTSGSIPGRVTIQDMQLKATGGANAAVRFANEVIATHLYRNIIHCDGLQAINLSPWTTSTSIIEGNLILATGSGTHGVSIENNGGTQTFNVLDNCLVMTGTAGSSVGVNLASGTCGGTLYNNFAGGFTTDCDWTPTSGTHNGTTAAAGGFGATGRVNNVVLADAFVSATVDFRLKAASALLDVGTNSFGPSTDRIGQAISNTTKDIGGWEYQAAATFKLLTRVQAHGAFI